ncbi:MAG: response regulator transcription factor [Rhodospirillales bacterium]|nr:MAG: response regulator transcription factor [Rhodospirillales bacterium]
MTAAARVLVVDDEPQIQRFLRPGLTAAGYDVVAAGSGAEALRALAVSSIDVVVLDLGLPDMDGKDVIAEARRWSGVPIIVLSARDREGEKIAALDLGANDYVAKPFAIGELLARIRAALRSRGGAADPSAVIAIGDLVVDLPAHRVTVRGAPVRLTPKEFELLAALAGGAGRVMTHRQILSRVWGPAHTADTQYLRVFIGQLRQKIELDPGEPTLILTEPGVGYRLADPAG